MRWDRSNSPMVTPHGLGFIVRVTMAGNQVYVGSNPALNNGTAVLFRKLLQNAFETKSNACKPQWFDKEVFPALRDVCPIKPSFSQRLGNVFCECKWYPFGFLGTETIFDRTNVLKHFSTLSIGLRCFKLGTKRLSSLTVTPAGFFRTVSLMKILTIVFPEYLKHFGLFERERGAGFGNSRHVPFFVTPQTSH